jgi:RNA polymerase sigma-70 factor (ECF subfamily)
MEGSTVVDDLQAWLAESYAQSVRTAFLILGNRLDAEDAVQEAFLRAWKFRNSLSKESSFKPWLYRVVVNSCNTRLRQEIPHRDHRSGEEFLVEVAATNTASDRFALSHDMMSALKDLPEHLRVVVVLRYYVDLSEREIAIAISRQPGTVKSRLNEAKKRLSGHPALQHLMAETPTPRNEVTK